jgi:stearoyl-CoA desaturase (delta-9 desaturase)
MVWGGLLRIFLYQHATFSVNSICHMFGKKDYLSRDEARNNWIVALLVFGEGWHNNHHAFPASARHGLRRFQIDLSWLVIRGLEKLGLVWNVRTPNASQLERRRVQSVDA